MKLQEIELVRIDGQKTTMAEYSRQVVLVVNTACLWGFTPQFGELETLWQTYKEKGFVVLGFPCNQFGGQDPWHEAKIQDFTKDKYGVTFPMFSKIEVNGPDTHPLYRYMKEFGSGEYNKDIRWNFTKFLLDRNGHVAGKYDGSVKPSEIAPDIEKYLSRE